MASTTPKPFCFVLMPFEKAFDDVYQIGIKESCTAAGAYCERVDEQTFDGRILDRIYNQISKADIVIADMTGRNPNVFYEVGYAHALGKRTILATRNGDDIPFDLKHFPHIIFGDSLFNLREQLTKKLQWFIENPEITQAATQLPFQLFAAGTLLGSDEVEYTFDPGRFNAHVQVVVQNIAPGILPSGSIKVAAIVQPETATESCFDERKGYMITSLPDKSIQALLPDLPDLFPSQCMAVEAEFWMDSRRFVNGLPVKIRVFTAQGPFDFHLKVCSRSQ